MLPARPHKKTRNAARGRPGSPSGRRHASLSWGYDIINVCQTTFFLMDFDWFDNYIGMGDLKGFWWVLKLDYDNVSKAQSTKNFRKLFYEWQCHHFLVGCVVHLFHMARCRNEEATAQSREPQMCIEQGAAFENKGLILGGYYHQSYLKIILW